MMRYATVAAACLLVVLAGVGAASAVHGSGDHVDVAGTDAGGSTTTTSSTTSTTTTTTTIPVAPPQCCTTPPSIGPTTTTGTEPHSPRFAPTVLDFGGTVTVDRRLQPPAIVVGETVDVETSIFNISDHRIWTSSTLVPNALATVCRGESGAQSLWWMTNILLEPWASAARGGSFTPTEDYVGEVTCQLKVVTSDGAGDAFDTSAGGDEARATIVGSMLGVPTVIFTVVASSTTTVPESTTTTAPAAPPGA
jgi:hypothetical protein